jgi:hypothetical protein
MEIGIISGKPYGLIMVISPTASSAVPHTLAYSYGILYSQSEGFEAFRIGSQHEECVLANVSSSLSNGDRLRIEISSGKVYFQYRHDNQWNTLYQEYSQMPVPIGDVGQCYVYIYGYSSIDCTGVAYISYFSLQKVR